MKIVCDFAYATIKIVSILGFALATIAVERVLKFNEFIRISAYAILKLRAKFFFFQFIRQKWMENKLNQHNKINE